MVKIRLRRTGARNQPSYRLVVADARAPRDGRFIETIGHYNPRRDPPEIVVKEERALYWLQHGAQPTDTARSLLRQAGIMEKFAALRRSQSPKKANSETESSGAPQN
ncbi:MAG TPA: 30S ribosomal protein S16 [Armatimonadetes bacterium]|nr:30S ribosomal protein S16 [Armatimonadota bacterium]